MRWRLRIELWDDEVPIPTRIQRNISNVRQHLKTMFENITSQWPGWKCLDRVEAALATSDLQKQIRHCMNNWHNPKSRYIIFSDAHSSSGQCVTLEEWKHFAKLIEAEVNEVIHARCGVLLTCDLSSVDD
jgi:hypothetical protein